MLKKIKNWISIPLAILVALGINYIFKTAPVGMFFEIVPLVDLVPNTEFSLSGAIGLRYYLGGKYNE